MEKSVHRISMLDQVRMLRILLLKLDLRYSDETTENVSDSSIAIEVNKGLNTCKTLQEGETIIAQRADITPAAFLLRLHIAKIERRLTLIKVEIIMNNWLTSVPESINLLVNLRELTLETNSLKTLPDMSQNAHLKHLKFELNDLTQLEPASIACIERLKQTQEDFLIAFKTPYMRTYMNTYSRGCNPVLWDSPAEFDDEIQIDPTRIAYLNSFNPRGIFPERRYH